MEKFGYVYGLIDPRNSTLKYVGKTEQTIKARLHKHLTPCELKTTTKKNNWINFLLKSELKPIAFEIECLPVEQLCEAEVFWIAYFKMLGADLLNGTIGGTGGRTWQYGKPRPKEFVEMLRQKNIGRPRPDMQTPEHRAKMKEIYSRPEVKAKMSLIRKEIANRPEFKEKASIRSKMLWQDPEYRAKRRESYLKRPKISRIVSEETRQKLSKRFKGVKRSPLALETRMKLAEATHKAFKGRQSPNKGKTAYPEWHEKVGKINWEIVREIRELFEAGVNNKVIGDKFGIDNSVVSRIGNNKSWVDPNYTPKPKLQRVLTWDDVDKIKLLLAEGKGPAEISRLTGFKTDRIQKIKSGKGWNPPVSKVGKQFKPSILTKENVIEIRQLLDEGIPAKDIGKRFGVSRSAITMIKQGRAWKNVS